MQEGPGRVGNRVTGACLGLAGVGWGLPPARAEGRAGKELIGLSWEVGFLSIAGTWPSSPFYDFLEGNPQSCLLLPQSCLPLTPALPRAEYMHGKHGVNVEVQGPHEARDGQLLIRLDLNRKEVLTLRLRNGGTQPVTLTHLFPFCRTPQFSFCNGDQELPCLLGPGEWVLKEPLVARGLP